jgi:basic membrane lipoprotein Med (substrate-binding protein (PBP1-ABC) superfamily)
VYGVFATPLEEPWDGAVHQALEYAAKKGQIVYRHTDNNSSVDKMTRTLNDLLTNEKPDIIVGDAFAAEQATRAIAKTHKDTAFVFGSGEQPVNPNYDVFDNWLQDPAYLAGMLAGGITKTNTIGVVAAMPIPEVNRIVNGFIQGAKEANPKTEVRVSYINSFYDPAAAKEAALAHVAAGADVLYAERFGVIEAAKEKGLPAFGSLTDQNSLAPDTVVTGPVWDMKPTVDYVIKQVKAGAYTAQDLKDFTMMGKGGAYLAPFHGWEKKLPPDVLDLVNKKTAAIKSGQFRVDINEADPTRK